jgi:DNA-binding MarR family transcriptional regulator
MDALQLYVLGRQLLKIADASFEESGTSVPARGLMLVLEDIATHPGSAISEITARTGLPQSHVSTSVGRFRERGMVETYADANDGRRTLVRAKPSYVRSADRRRTSSADNAIAAALEGASAATVRKLIADLESIAERLTPKTTREDS